MVASFECNLSEKTVNPTGRRKRPFFMDYGLFLKIANTGNDTQTGHRCPIQIAYRLWQFSKDRHISEASFYVMPDEQIMASSSIYCGITDNLLNSPDITTASLEESLTISSRLIQKVGNKNIYIIGWNVLEDIHDILENNLSRLNIDIFDDKNLKLIDLKKLAELSLPTNEVGHLGPDTTLFWLKKTVEKVDDNSNFKFLQNLRNERWQQTFCKTSIDIDVLCLKLLMEKLNLRNLDDVYVWLESPHKIDVLPFGKHKGELVSDVFVKDNEYLCWLYSCKDIMDKNKDLKYTLAELLSI